MLVALDVCFKSACWAKRFLAIAATASRTLFSAVGCGKFVPYGVWKVRIPWMLLNEEWTCLLHVILIKGWEDIENRA
jgi:hypothetical protein